MIKKFVDFKNSSKKSFDKSNIKNKWRCWTMHIISVSIKYILKTNTGAERFHSPSIYDKHTIVLIFARSWLHKNIIKSIAAAIASYNKSLCVMEKVIK